ncbi:MAG: Pvc16 family protein [Bacteroidota bacterium]
MALLNISHVTSSLINLLRQSFRASTIWAGAAPDILPTPPHLVSGSPTNAMGMYLYHIAEHAHYKNLPSPINSSLPARFSPMGLKLYYQLSANNTTTEGQAAIQEQLMMGVAMKALHDNAEISDTTQVNNQLIMHPDIQGLTNVFRICLQPVTPSEALSHWSTGDTPIKLSAYYEVSVALLRVVERPVRLARVLTHNVRTFTQGAPRILSSQNSIFFTYPGEARPRSVQLQAAQAPPSNPSAPVRLDDSLVTLNGSGLSGDAWELRLLHANWPTPLPVDAAFWELDDSQGQFRFRLLSQRFPNNAAEANNDLLPGIYTAQLEVTRGSIRHLSNQCPFTVVPRIDSISAPVADVYTLQGHRFQHPDLSPDDIQLYIGQQQLTLSAGGLADGQFRIVSANSLEFRLTIGRDLPVRLFINGAESPPRWISTP